VASKGFQENLALGRKWSDRKFIILALLSLLSATYLTSDNKIYVSFLRSN
jgi:hypothetical protein